VLPLSEAWTSLPPHQCPYKKAWTTLVGFFQCFSVPEEIQKCVCFVSACHHSEQFFLLLFCHFIIIIIACLSAENITQAVCETGD